jgi:RimJ/RimL family protein N-acetyltransferase
MGGQKLTLIYENDQLILRDRRPSDVEHFLRWMTTGEWRYFDAPWEGIMDGMSPEQKTQFRANFMEKLAAELPILRTTAVIELKVDNQPLGWVSRYGEKRFSDVYCVGIDICEDVYLNRGAGTAALRLWVNYLFENSCAHKIECHTWSFNYRMRRVAEKLGCQLEGRERELIEWNDQRQDRLRYGLLRSEWKLFQSPVS